jgi:enoyl-CoA hydratase/carnithine racemase
VNTEVLVHTEDRVRTVTINAPPRRNALSRNILAQLRHALSGTADISAVVLTGAGGVFSAGADLTELTGTAADLAFDDALALTAQAVRAAAVPVVAAIEGPCFGAAVDLALACDLRVCAETALLCVPAVQLGILYNPETIARLHRSLPRDTVTRLILLGERFTARAAEQADLVSTVVDEGAALDRALAIAADLAAIPQDALTHTKRLLTELDDGPLDIPRWQRVRRSLLDSPGRRDALDKAKRRITSRIETEEQTC